MKYVTGLLVNALMMTTTAVGAAPLTAAKSAAELTEERLQGEWHVVARVCESSGHPARDAFQLGRDHMVIIVSRTRATAVSVIQGQSADIWNGVFNTENEYLVMRPNMPNASDRRIAKIPFDLTQYPTLIFTTNGFGQGGSCAPGENLKTYFRLKGETK